jgi:hypothetical protein
MNLETKTAVVTSPVHRHRPSLSEEREASLLSLSRAHLSALGTRMLKSLWS